MGRITKVAVRSEIFHETKDVSFFFNSTTCLYDVLIRTSPYLRGLSFV